MKTLIQALAATTFLGVPALAEIVQQPASGSVAEVADRLEAAVTNAGATVFARVDHGAGAQSVDMDLAPAQLLIFGNPKLGTPAMQADPRAGLYLPLRVLVYEDAGGQVQVVYEEPGAMLGDLDVPGDAEFIGKMNGALQNLTGKAIGGS